MVCEPSTYKERPPLWFIASAAKNTRIPSGQAWERAAHGGSERMVFARHASHVQYGVAHTAESRVDADPGGAGNFLEAHVAIETHVDDFALGLREFLHQPLDVGEGLVVDELHLDAGLGQVDVVEQVVGHFVIRDGVFVPLIAELIHYQIVRDAGEPCGKSAGFGVASLAYGHDGFDESLLKEVVGHVVVTYEIEDIRVKPFLIAVKDDIECFVVPFCVEFHQRLVGECVHIFHYCNFCSWRNVSR